MAERRIAWVVVLSILISMFVISMLALSTSALLPDDVQVDFTVLKNKAGPGEWASFEVTITNKGIAYDVFTIINDLEGVEWSMLTEPQRTSIIIKGGTSEKVKILLKDQNLTRDWRRPQFVTVFVENKDRTVRKTVKLPVYLLPGKVQEGVYFDVTPVFPDRVDPRVPQSFKLVIKNSNWYEYQNVRVALKSADFERESFLSFAPNETKSSEFTVTFDPATPPKKETVAVTVSSGGVVYTIDEKMYEVIAYNTPFEQTRAKDSSFLKVTETITLRNVDNVDETQDAAVPASWLTRLLSTPLPDAAVRVVDGKKAYLWSIAVPAGDTAVVQLVTNYRLILYALFLITLVLFLWYMFRSPVLLLKRAEFVKTKEGAITEIDIRLTIENKSMTELRNVTLIDHVPALMQLVWKPKHTFRPKKITAVPHGHVMYWNFDLTPQEERILTYTVAPKLSVIGELHLPPAALKYIYDRHELKAHSNDVYVTNLRMDEKDEMQG